MWRRPGALIGRAVVKNSPVSSVGACIEGRLSKHTRAPPSLARTVQAMKKQQAQSSEAGTNFKPQAFSNLLVVDFEATCNRFGPKPEPQEIIEFPVLNIRTDTFEEVSRFHSYVQPDVNKELSDFCTELTGIIQGMVDDQPSLVEVMAAFDDWLQQNQLHDKPDSVAVVTFGDWDVGTALATQCRYLGRPVPVLFRRWINLKRALFEFWGQWPRGLPHALKQAQLTQHGRHHSGIDDCVNIAALVRYLGQNGYVFHVTGSHHQNDA